MNRITLFLLSILLGSLMLASGEQQAYSHSLDTPASTALQPPSGSGPTINVPVVHITDAPAMDGKCEPQEYGAANTVSYTYLPNFQDHIVYILRTPHHLYFCFWLLGPVGMPEAGTEEDAVVSVFVDRLNDGQLGGDDLVIRQPFLDAADAATWDAADNSFSGDDPGGWQVVNFSHPGTGEELSRHWTSAEFRIERQTLGGWQRTVGFAVTYQHIPCPLTCLIENYGWPHNNVFDRPQDWGNANLATGEITIGPTDVIPTIDGRCDLAQEWGNAAFVQFPSGNGLASARAKHSDSDLYVCLVLFKPAAAVADGPNAAVQINRTGEGGERPGPDDMRFTISYEGTVRANRGDGSGWGGPDPGGYSIARQDVNLPNTNLWHAEFRISGDTLGGGWDRDIDIGFSQQWLNFVGDDYGWPVNSWWWNIPNNWGVGHLTSTPRPQARDIRPTGMEVVQTVQDLDNSVTLVANKRTFVRVHVDTDRSVTGVTARLHGYRNGVPLGFPLLPANPGADINIIAGSGNRGALHDSFYFELPGPWTNAGTISLRAEINPYQEIVERSYFNNDFLRPINTFEQTNPLRLRLVNYQYVTPGDTLLTVDSFHMDMAESQLRRMFPISRLIADRRIVVDLTIDSVPKADYVNARLRHLRNVWESRGDSAPHRFTYGMVSDMAGRMRGKSDGIPSRIASGPAGVPDGIDDPHKADTWDFDGTYADFYAGHELGHALGRYHAEFCEAEDGRDYPYPEATIGGPAGEPDRFYGFDAGDGALGLKTTIVPNTWTDVMSYCPSIWISDFTYEGIHNYIRDNLGPQTVAPATVATPAQGDYLAVYGSIDVAAQTATIPVVSRQAEVGEIPERVPGDYHIRLYDGDGNILADYPFSPLGAGQDAHESGAEMQQIAQIVDWVAGTARIAVYSDVSQQELVSRHVSAHAPGISIVERTGGEALPASGPLTLSWNGADEDGDELEYLVLYSFDDRASWRALATTRISNTLTIDTAQLEGTGGNADGWLRVVANDGVLTAHEDSGPFQVADKTPDVTIASPAPDSTYAFGQTVALEGVARDFEEGTLADGQLSWHSSLDGELGAGALLHPALLSVGDHTITLRAVDSAGNEASATVTITVAPTVEDDEPTLAAAPISMSYLAEAGAGNPAPQRLSVRNTGGGQLEWRAAVDAAWVTLDVGEGTAPAEIMVSVDTAGFRAGQVYDAAITIEGGGQTVRVPLLVQMKGDLHEALFLPAFWSGGQVENSALSRRLSSVGAAGVVEQTYNDAVAGYALVRGDGELDQAFAYNRSGGGIEVTHPITGAYSVFFVDSASDIEGNGHVQVTPMGANTHCMVTAWGTFGANNHRVDLLCLDNNAGERVNVDFSLLLLDEGGRGGNNDNLAFAYSQDGAPASGELDLTGSEDTHHPGGGETVLFHTGPGQYSVVFRDLGQVMTATTHVQVTPVLTQFMSPYVVSCGLAAQWEIVSGNLAIPIQCTDINGNPLDAEFNVLVTSGQASAPGFAFALNDVLDNTEFTELTNEFVYNPWGAVRVRRLNGLDGYLLHFLGVSTEDGGNIIVTPVAAPGTSCAILRWDALNNGEGITVRIRCFSATRTHVDAMFSVLSTFVDATPPEQYELFLPVVTQINSPP